METSFTNSNNDTNTVWYKRSVVQGLAIDKLVRSRNKTREITPIQVNLQ